jgi:hypothetical protein
MRNFLRLFSLWDIILLAAIVLLGIGIKDIYRAYGKQGDLKQHIGIVEKKSISAIQDGEYKSDSLRTVTIKLVGDKNYYFISMSAEKVNTLVNEGDSVELFTKAIITSDGNRVTNGSNFWYSTEPNQIFQVISKKYAQPIVSIHEYQHALRSGAWIAPVLSICFFLCYFSQYIRGDFFTFYIGKRKFRLG